MNSNRGRLVITIICAIIVPLLVLTFVITSCDTSSTTPPSASTTVDYDASDDLAEEVISSTVDELNFSTEQLSYMNLVYNPYTMEVGDSLVVFPHYAKQNGFCTLYLVGVSDPKSIKVEGWFLIEKTVIDSGLIKILICNQGIDNTVVSDGKITYDGSRTVYIR